MCHQHILSGLIIWLLIPALASHNADFKGKHLNMILTTRSGPSSSMPVTFEEPYTTSLGFAAMTDVDINKKDMLSIAHNDTASVSSSYITTHTPKGMSYLTTVDDMNGIESVDNKHYICVIVKKRYQKNATLDSISCSVPKDSKMSEVGLMSYCRISLMTWEAIAFIGGHCTKLKPNVLEQFENRERGQMVAMSNGTMSSVKIVCLSPKKIIGNLANNYMCPVVEGSIELSDHSKLSDYLMNVCKVPRAVINKANIKIVEAVRECVDLRNSHDTLGNSKNEWTDNNMITLKLSLAISSIGVVLNLAGLAVLVKGGVENTRGCRGPLYFIIMSVIDTLDLLCTNIKYLVWVNILPPLPAVVCQLTVATSLIGTMLSTFCLLAITIERYVAICHPMRVKTFLSRERKNKVRVSIVFE